MEGDLGRADTNRTVESRHRARWIAAASIGGFAVTFAGALIYSWPLDSPDDPSDLEGGAMLVLSFVFAVLVGVLIGVCAVVVSGVLSRKGEAPPTDEL